MLEIKYNGKEYFVYKANVLQFTVKHWREIWERV
jgi:isocitrate/isopropylmalate dehydrogenase